MIKAILILAIGYLAGCFQTAYIIGKTNKHIDIRQYGSGNSGTTNALRVMGVKLGVLTFIGDFFKGFLTVWMVLFVTKDSLLAVLAAAGVILGHDFPIFLNFRGGKGIASTLGIAFALDYRAGLVGVAIMISVIFISRYVSVASITLCIGLPICFYVLGIFGTKELCLLAAISGLGIYQHRDNIRRLLRREEHKLSFKKKTKM